MISEEGEATSFDLSFDPVFAFFPIPHVGLLAGPLIDIGLSSSASGGSVLQSESVKVTNYGVAAGLAAFF